MTTSRATASVDGGSRGNPGEAGCGFVLKVGDVVEEHFIFLGRTTNNVAEYAGLLGAMERALELGVAELVVRSDSELLVKQLSGAYKVRAEHLQPLWARAKGLARRFARCSVTHVGRAANKRADTLANRAMDTRSSTRPVPEGVG